MCHAHPVFSRDEKSVYFSWSLEKDLGKTPVDYLDLSKVQAVRADISAVKQC